MNGDPTARALGRKVAFYRGLRGLSQRDLAAMMDRSEAWVSQVERGLRRVDRMTVLRTLAEALDVHVAELAADTPLVAAVNERSQAAIGLRMLLSSSLALRLTLQPPEPAPVDLGELREAVEQAWALAHEVSYDPLLSHVTATLPRLEAAVRSTTGKDRRAAYALLARTYHSCARALAKLGEKDAAWIAADRAITAAERSGDRLLMAESAFRLILVFQVQRAYDQAYETGVTAAEALQPLVEGGDVPATAVQGALRLQLAVAAARQSNVSEAYRQVAKARELAAVVGEGRNDYNTEFGPTNVALHEVTVAIDVGDAGTALRVAEEIDPSGLSLERQGRLGIDRARAWQQRRQFGRAVASLLEAERLSPDQVRRHRVVRVMLNDIARAGYRDDELRALAERCGVKLR